MAGPERRLSCSFLYTVHEKRVTHNKSLAACLGADSFCLVTSQGPPAGAAGARGRPLPAPTPGSRSAKSGKTEWLCQAIRALPHIVGVARCSTRRTRTPRTKDKAPVMMAVSCPSFKPGVVSSASAGAPGEGAAPSTGCTGGITSGSTMRSMDAAMLLRCFL